ncbi:MAG: hypothetical protein ACLQJR_30425 [Stellaceae bacterium]
MNQPLVYAVTALVGYGLSDFMDKQAAAADIHFPVAQIEAHDPPALTSRALRRCWRRRKTRMG